MSIKYQCFEGDKLLVIQNAKRPMIYFDNWAINKFSKEAFWGDKFIEIVKRIGGTVSFSILNLYEIVIRDDEKQKDEIAKFVSKLDDALIEINPYKVIKRERLSANNSDECFNNSAWAQQGLIEKLALYGRPLKPLNVAEIIYQLNDEIKCGLSIEVDFFEKKLMPLIKLCREIEEKKKAAKYHVGNKIKLKKIHMPYTEELIEYAINYIVSNEAMNMGEKEWRDLYHLIVPLAYCDFVLVDKRWVHFSKTTGLQYPDIAKVYTSNSVINFINELKDYNYKEPKYISTNT